MWGLTYLFIASLPALRVVAGLPNGGRCMSLSPLGTQHMIAQFVLKVCGGWLVQETREARHPYTVPASVEG